MATQCSQRHGERQETKGRARYGCWHFNEPREGHGAAFQVLCSCGTSCLEETTGRSRRKVLMEPRVRCETRNRVGQCFPFRARQSRNPQTLITGSTESHRLLPGHTSLTEVKQQRPGAGKMLGPFTWQSPHLARGKEVPWTHLSKPALPTHGRRTGPAPQASAITISQDTVTATHAAGTGTNHEPP